MGNTEYIKLIKKDIDKMDINDVIKYIYYCSRTSPREYILAAYTNLEIRNMAKTERHLRSEEDARVLNLYRLDKLNKII